MKIQPGILSFAILAFAAGCHKGQVAVPAPTAAAPVAVEVVLPHRGEIARSIALPSLRVLPLQEATLYAKVAGYLKVLRVDKGDRVQQGDVLAELEAPELLADEAQFKAELAVARANFERMSEARQKSPDLVVPQTIEDLRGTWEVAQAKLQRTETLQHYTRIIAPFSGVVTARFMDVGAFVPAATASSTPQNAAILTLMDFTRLRVQVAVPQVETPFVTNGLPAQITLEELPGKVMTAAVTRFAPALDPMTRTMLAEIELDNSQGQVKPGSYAMVKLELERKRDALLLPVSAVLVEKAGPSVFFAKDGLAKKSRVRTGYNDGKNVEVLEGVAADQPVLISGQQPLTDGRPVKVREGK